MSSNATDHLTNSTQPDLTFMCSLMGKLAWKQQYLTPTSFIMFVIAASVEALMCPFTILLNAFVICAVKRKRYLQKKKSNVLLACMAGTDLFIGLVALPLEITSHVQHILGVGPICLIDKIALETSNIAFLASIFHLVIISGERYIAIKHALRYETLVTTHRLTKAVAAAWAVPVIIGLVSLAFDVAGEIELKDELMNMLAIFIVLSSVIVISFCQVTVYLESRRHRKHINAHQVSESSAKEIIQNDKAFRTNMIIVGALCICFSPPMIFYPASLNVKSLSGLFYAVDVLTYFNSLINPLIYCVRTQEFRRAFRELLNLQASQINAEYEMNIVGRPQGQRKDNGARTDSSHKKKKIAWPDPTSPRGSRSRSLDLSEDSTHGERTRRTHSV